MGFSKRPGGRIVKYGYRVGEIGLPPTGDAKVGTVIRLLVDQDHTKRVPVQLSLGCHVVGATYPHPDPNHAETIACSIRKRIACQPPRPIPERLREFRAFVDSFVRNTFTPFGPGETFSVSEWLGSSNYPLSRRVDLERTYRKHCENPLPNWEVELVKCFVKMESYPSYKHARAIYSRSDTYKCLVGPVFAKIERVLFSGKSFIKKCPVQDRPSFILESLGRDGLHTGRGYLATDYTAYESHFTADIMDSCENIFYKHMVQNHPEASAVIDRHIRVARAYNNCFFKCARARILAGRMSGEMNTSLGNSFTNLMVALYAAHKAGLVDFRVVVEGDDSLASYIKSSSGEAREYEKIIRELGFNLKIETHEKLSTASFCGLVFCEETKLNLPNPKKHLNTTGWISGKYCRSKEKKLLELLKGKAMSLMASARGCPILQSFALYLLRCTEGSHFRIDCYWARQFVLNANIQPSEVTLGSRMVVENVYGIDIATQLYIEDHFDSLNVLCPIDDPIVMSLYDEDNHHCFDNYVREDVCGKYPTFLLPNQL